jgi:hypothetical protein
MLKWLLISFAVVIVLIVGLLGTLYYLVFVKDVALARPITYESEEQAVASGMSDMLDGLLGIELTPAQETELEEIISGFSAEPTPTHDFDDLIDFITDPTSGIMATNPISLTGQRSLELTETQLTALINLMIGSVDSFFDIDGVSSADGALTYSVGDMGNVKLSGVGMNINAEDIAVILTITLPEDIPYAGFLLGGKQISLGLNPTIAIADNGDVTLNANIDAIKVGGISAGWPGVSHAINYAMDQFDFDSDSLEWTFNITDPLNSALGSELGLSFAVAEGQMSFSGPAPLSAGMEIFDFTEQEQDAYAAAAQDAIDDFLAGDSSELTLSEEEITALMTESIEEVLTGGEADLGIDLEGFSVNVEEGGQLAMTSTVTVPEGTDLGIPEGSEIEVGLVTEVVIDEEGNASLEVVGFDLGGLPDETLEELGLDAETLNDALAGSGVDLADALGLPEGSLTGLSTDAEGNLTLTGD